MNLTAFFYSILILMALQTSTCSQHKGNGYERKGQLLFIENFSSNYVPERHVEIYLPPDYDTTKRYPVMYMHDGQNVFNAETSYTKIDWGIDEAADALILSNKIEPIIIVASWNTPFRYNEYMPQDCLEKDVRFDGKEVYSNRYLQFIVEELKPYIDEHYSTKTDQSNTAIMGSSMGGMISAYAISKYPEVFGKAGCISTHFPAMDGVFIDYLIKHLPDAESHKLYFDRGTTTLDRTYEPFQNRFDALMRETSYEEGKNWKTLVFEGAAHSEKSWRKRIHVPLEFLFGK